MDLSEVTLSKGMNMKNLLILTGFLLWYANAAAQDQWYVISGKDSIQLRQLEAAINEHYNGELELTDSVIQLIEQTQTADGKIKAIRLLGKLNNPKSAAFILRNFTVVVFPATTYEECCFPYAQVIDEYAKSSLSLQAYIATLSRNPLTKDDFERLKYIVYSYNSKIPVRTDPYFNTLQTQILSDGISLNDYLLKYDSTAYESDGALLSGLANASQDVRDTCAGLIKKMLRQTGKDALIDYKYVQPDSLYTGIWRNYFFNGEVYTAKSYENGLLSGSSYEYYPDGNLKSSMYFQDNKLIEFREYNPQGALTLKRRVLPDSTGYETFRY